MKWFINNLLLTSMLLCGGLKMPPVSAQNRPFEFAGEQKERDVVMNAREDAAMFVLESRIQHPLKQLSEAAENANPADVAQARLELQNEVRKAPLIRKIVEAWRNRELTDDNAETWSLENGLSEPPLVLIDPNALRPAVPPAPANEENTSLARGIVSDLEQKAESIAAVDLAALSAQGSLDARFVTAAEGTSYKWSYARAKYLLPPPVQQNDSFVSRFDSAETSMGRGPALFDFSGTATESEKVRTRFQAMSQFGMRYDTSRIERYDATTVPLSGNDIVGAGQTSFFSNPGNNGAMAFDEIPFTLAMDNQVVEFLGRDDVQLQVYAEANNHFANDELEFEHLYARLWNHENLTFGVGKTDSLFEVGGTMIPSGLIGPNLLVGTSSLRNASMDMGTHNRSQIRVQYRSSPGIEWSFALEDPLQFSQSDFALPADAVYLSRWPNLATRLMLSSSDDCSEAKLQMSSLIRPLGFEDAGRTTHFDTGWGLAAYLQLTDKVNRNAFYAGVAGGEGVGQYIRGVSVSAGGNGTTDPFEALGGVGAYAGVTHESDLELGARMLRVESNVAYGYAHTETPGFLGSSTNVNVHQGWANIIALPTEQVGVGIEYQFASREVNDGDNGENHRFMLIVAIRAQPPGNAKAEDASEARLIQTTQIHGSSSFAQEWAAQRRSLYQLDSPAEQSAFAQSL